MFSRKEMRWKNPKYARQDPESALNRLLKNPVIQKELGLPQEQEELYVEMKKQADKEGGSLSRGGMRRVLGNIRFGRGRGRTIRQIGEKEIKNVAWQIFPSRFTERFEFHSEDQESSTGDTRQNTPAPHETSAASERDSSRRRQLRPGETRTELSSSRSSSGSARSGSLNEKRLGGISSSSSGLPKNTPSPSKPSPSVRGRLY